MTPRPSSMIMLFTLLAPFAAAAATAPAATKASIVFGSCPQKPVWPEAAKQEKRQGAVVLVFQVDADNSVLDAQVKGSSGHPDLDEAARAGLAKCKFKAATRDGTPVRDWAQVTYRWTHDRAGKHAAMRESAGGVASRLFLESVAQ